MLKHLKDQNGQTLVILLLVMVVVLAIGLSVATRSITDLRISTQTEESSRAFSAAEAGIEEALRQDLSTLAGQGQKEISLPGVKKATYEVKTVGGYETQIKKDDVGQINLEGYAGTITVYWAKKGTSEETNQPSLEITVIYNDFTMDKWAYNTLVGRGNGFWDASLNPPEESGYLAKNPNDKPITIAVAKPAKIMRVKPFYADATVKVVPTTGTLPSQSYAIEGTATTEGGITRKVQVTRSLPALPAIFDYVLFSGTGITK